MKNTLKAIFFDFDGIIVHSKGIEYESWRRVYSVFDCYLNIKKWIKVIDNIQGVYDPALILFSECLYRYHRKINRKTVRTLQANLYNSMLSHLNAIPGAIDIIKECSANGVLLGLASNTTKEKATYHLKRLKIFKYFNAIVCKEDVVNKKPSPDVYNLLLTQLKLKPEQALVFEDSPTGILAAKTANIMCISLPNKITKHLDLSGADLTVEKFKNLNFSKICKMFESYHPQKVDAMETPDIGNTF
jgi:HAD superfamily hydrolase (TIGR01509 family)